ncbi:MAG: hypothetical protein IH614_12035 [Desulfuromonadales bacterium]|nr:hypothetical protein [Desulfuromonadales bacterium]
MRRNSLFCLILAALLATPLASPAEARNGGGNGGAGGSRQESGIGNRAQGNGLGGERVREQRQLQKPEEKGSRMGTGGGFGDRQQLHDSDPDQLKSRDHLRDPASHLPTQDSQ